MNNKQMEMIEEEEDYIQQ